ncbi:MAG: dimethyl sulfoxide reductase anchor subunit family protein [Vicinamibacterales bacterium]
MNLRDWSLVAFTLLMQTSVGILLVVAALPLVAGRQAASPANRLAGPVAVATVAGIAALAISLLHLGRPLQAWLAVANVQRSWLSREIVLAVAFVAAAAGFAWIRTHAAAPAFRVPATAATVATGVALVFAMARIYMIPGQPPWNRAATPVGFYLTTALLGLVVVVALAGPLISPRSARILGFTALAVLAFQVILVPITLAAVAGEPAPAISAASAGHVATWLAAGRIVLAVAAAVLLVALLRSDTALRTGDASRIAVLVLVVLSEIFSRTLFYATAVRL